MDVTGSYITFVHGVYVCISGEQLLYPMWHITRVLSTSAMNLVRIRLWNHVVR